MTTEEGRMADIFMLVASVGRPKSADLQCQTLITDKGRQGQ